MGASFTAEDYALAVDRPPSRIASENFVPQLHLTAISPSSPLARMSQLPPAEPLTSQELDQSSQRLFWSGAAANGALTLALISFAGGADDQIAALRTITLPVVVAIAGFSCGGVAIKFSGARLAQRLVDAVAHRKLVLAHYQQTAFKEVLSSPSMDASTAQLVWGDRAEDEIRKLILGRLANAQAETDRSQQIFDDAMATLEVSTKTGERLFTKANYWLQVSFVAAALAVVTLLVQAWLVTSEPTLPKNPVPAVEAPTVAAADASSTLELPPCREGEADCDPWERDWKKPPAVGKVVPGSTEPE